MYFLPKEHNPPHIHVIYGDETFSITIRELSIIDGEPHPSSRTLSMVKEWILIHQDELLDMWDTQELHSVEPLR